MKGGFLLDVVIRESSAIQGNRLSREGLDKDLHGTTSKSKDKMKGGFLLDVVIRESSAILELFSSEDQPLLLWWNSFLVLNLSLDIRDCVIWLDVQGDRLSREGLDENLHGTTAETKDKMKGGLLLNVVVRESSAIFELFSCEDQSL